MDIKQEQRGAVQILTPVGRLDTDSATDLELALQDLRAVDVKHYVIDMSEIGYVSSAGLRVLLLLAKQLDGGAGTLRLAGLNPQVKQVFDIAGFSKLFKIAANKEAALADHPNVKDASPALGKLAAKLIGAGQKQAAAASSSGVSAAAAALLGGGAKAAGPKITSKPMAPVAVEKRGPSDQTMALKSIQTPAAPPLTAAAPAAPGPAKKKPGFFARLFGRK
jgi:anti-anti-sigma factor